MPWYDGPTLIGYLETVEVDDERMRGRAVPHAGAVGEPARPRLPRLRRHDRRRHGAAGRRDPRAAVAAARARVARIVTFDGDLDEAVAGQSVTLTLADEIDVSRGDVLAAADAPAGRRRPVRGDVVWMDDEPMLPRPPLPDARSARSSPPRRSRRSSTRSTSTRSSTSRRRSSSSTRSASCNLELDRPIAFDPYDENRDIGGFILIDRITNDDGRRGHAPLRAAPLARTSTGRRSTSTRRARAALKGQQPCVLWFTGLSGAGKSTIANLVEKRAARAAAATPTCSTATTSATGSTRTSASPTPTASRTSAASPRWRG